MWAKVQDGVVVAYPYGLSELRRDCPQTSFPDEMSAEGLAEFGLFPVFSQEPPWHDPMIQNCTRVWPMLFEDGWVETWELTTALPDEVAARAAEKAASIRSQRNFLLTHSDWTQLADAPVDREAWAAYRQALRDLTLSPGFPGDVTWPLAP